MCGHLRRAVAGILLMLATAVPALIALAPAPAMAASDHATLLVTSPAAGSIVTTGPKEVVLTFDEAVSVSPNSIKVLSPSGRQVEDPPATPGSSAPTAEVGLRSGLGHGTYTVTWQVVSDDSHPVSGTFAFSIGAPSRTLVPAGATRIHQSPAAITLAFGVARWLGYLSLAVLVGGMAFILFGWPIGVRDPAARRLLTSSVVCLAAATLAQLVLQGSYSATSNVSLLSPDTLQSVLASRYGHALALRLILLAALTIVIVYVWPLLDDTRHAGPGSGPAVRPGAVLAWAIGAAGLAATWSGSAHAAVGSQVGFSVTADIVHLVSMSVWVGGLVMLCGVLLRRRSLETGSEGAMVTAVRRFSAMAMISVAVLALSGLYEAWRNVGTFAALADTGYGHVLLLKTTGLAVLISLGYLSRSWTRRLVLQSESTRHASLQPVGARGPASGLPAPAEVPGEARGGGSLKCDAALLRRLRLSVSIETAIVLIVLALSAVLVEMPTGREAAAQTKAPQAAIARLALSPAGTSRLSQGPAAAGIEMRDPCSA